MGGAGRFGGSPSAAPECREYKAPSAMIGTRTNHRRKDHWGEHVKHERNLDRRLDYPATGAGAPARRGDLDLAWSQLSRRRAPGPGHDRGPELGAQPCLARRNDLDSMAPGLARRA